MPASPAGNTFAGYELVRELGQGAMGKVLLARQPSLDRFVALKLLKPELARDEEFVTRFRREARAAAVGSHPNVVAVMDRGRDEATGLHYIAFEHLPGGDLEARLRERGALPEAEVLALLEPMAAALRFAEERELVHRDVKPENILFDAEGVPKLADLGLVRFAGDARTTQTGVVMGTPHYMAPEQALGDGPVDVRADVYALGLVAWRCLTGRVPFDEDGGASAMQILTRHIQQDLPDVRQAAPHVSEATAVLVAGMTARDPEVRYWARALARDVRRVRAGRRPLGPQVLGSSDALPKLAAAPRGGPRPGLALAAVLLAGGLAGALGAALALRGEPPAPPGADPTVSASPRPSPSTPTEPTPPPDAPPPASPPPATPPREPAAPAREPAAPAPAEEAAGPEAEPDGPAAPEAGPAAVEDPEPDVASVARLIEAYRTSVLTDLSSAGRAEEALVEALARRGATWTAAERRAVEGLVGARAEIGRLLHEETRPREPREVSTRLRRLAAASPDRGLGLAAGRALADLARAAELIEHVYVFSTDLTTRPADAALARAALAAELPLLPAEGWERAAVADVVALEGAVVTLADPAARSDPAHDAALDALDRAPTGGVVAEALRGSVADLRQLRAWVLGVVAGLAGGVAAPPPAKLRDLPRRVAQPRLDVARALDESLVLAGAPEGAPLHRELKDLYARLRKAGRVPLAHFFAAERQDLRRVLDVLAADPEASLAVAHLLAGFAAGEAPPSAYLASRTVTASGAAELAEVEGGYALAVLAREAPGGRLSLETPLGPLSIGQQPRPGRARLGSRWGALDWPEGPTLLLVELVPEGLVVRTAAVDEGGLTWVGRAALSAEEPAGPERAFALDPERWDVVRLVVLRRP